MLYARLEPLKELMSRRLARKSESNPLTTSRSSVGTALSASMPRATSITSASRVNSSTILRSLSARQSAAWSQGSRPPRPALPSGRAGAWRGGPTPRVGPPAALTCGCTLPRVVGALDEVRIVVLHVSRHVVDDEFRAEEAGVQILPAIDKAQSLLFATALQCLIGAAGVFDARGERRLADRVKSLLGGHRQDVERLGVQGRLV